MNEILKIERFKTEYDIDLFHGIAFGHSLVRIQKYGMYYKCHEIMFLCFTFAWLKTYKIIYK